MNPPKDNMRYEVKYFLPGALVSALRGDLMQSATLDLHSDSASGGYGVSTLYFDSPSLREYHDKIAGVAHRTKFRIRSYGTANAPVLLEMKEKLYNAGRKHRVALDATTAEALRNGRFPWTLRDNPVAQCFWQRRAFHALRPVASVEYRREAYFWNADKNVRVTIDTDVIARRASTGCSHTNYRVTSRGSAILELKWVDAFPAALHALIQRYSLRNAALSKYCLGIDALFRAGAIPDG